MNHLWCYEIIFSTVITSSSTILKSAHLPNLTCFRFTRPRARFDDKETRVDSAGSIIWARCMQQLCPKFNLVDDDGVGGRAERKVLFCAGSVVPALSVPPITVWTSWIPPRDVTTDFFRRNLIAGVVIKRTIIKSPSVLPSRTSLTRNISSVRWDQTRIRPPWIS